MHTDRDVTRLVRSWLRNDEHESATRLVSDVVSRLDSIPQHRSWWPVWRNVLMHSYAKLALGGAAILVAAIVGINLLPNGRVLGGPQPTSSSSPSASPSASSSIGGAPLEAFLVGGTRYAVPGDLVSFTFVPSNGWSYDGVWFHARARTPDEVMLSFYTRPANANSGVFTDPCAHTGLQAFEHTISGDAAEAASVPGVVVLTGPTSISVGGRPALAVSKRVPTDVGCSNTQFWLSHDPACGVRIACTSYPTWLGETMYSWFIDVGGHRLSVTAEMNRPDPSPPSVRELQQMVDSIEFP
jgi:hypothetical protein